jgi:hypothetical protein
VADNRQRFSVFAVSPDDVHILVYRTVSSNSVMCEFGYLTASVAKSDGDHLIHRNTHGVGQGLR